MKTNHTPGPWRVGGIDGGCQYDIQSSESHVARVSHYPGGDTEAASTARLIAAAPDLLGALSGILAQADKLADGPTWTEELSAAAHKARRTIAKATEPA